MVICLRSQIHGDGGNSVAIMKVKLINRLKVILTRMFSIALNVEEIIAYSYLMRILPHNLPVQDCISEIINPD